MVLSGVIVLLILAIAIMAFLGIFGRFPDNWEWFGIILATMGLVMSTPHIFQMLWGRAKLEIEFDRYIKDAERGLIIHLKNPPLKSKWAKRLGVRRESIQSLATTMRIYEAGSGKIVDPVRNLRLYPDDDPGGQAFNRISLPPTYSVGAAILVALWDEEHKAAMIMPDRLRDALPLGPGYYRLEIIFLVDGEPEVQQMQFKVGTGADDLIWAG